jgi:hypothetical protein
MKAIRFFILLFLSFLLNGSCRINWQEALIYYIPYGYIGSLLIVYDQKNGQAKEYEDGRRVYRFDQNGILLTQFPIDKPGVRSQNEIFYIKDNEKIAVRQLSNSECSTIQSSENYKKSKTEIFFVNSLEGGRISTSKTEGYFIHFIGNYYPYKKLNINDICLDNLILIEDCSDTTKLSVSGQCEYILRKCTYQEILEVKNKCISSK